MNNILAAAVAGAAGKWRESMNIVGWIDWISSQRKGSHRVFTSTSTSFV